jgi:RNA polymerase sigma-70 factor, ECF subfamily
MGLPAPDSVETERLLRQVRGGDVEAADALFERHRSYLLRLIELRLDPKLRPRVDASDIVQDAHLEALRRLKGYLERPALPFRLWLRQIAFDRLLMAHRRHAQAARRSVERDVPFPDRSSLMLARQLFAVSPSPSQRLRQQEFALRVHHAIHQLPEADREVLVLRQLEGLSNQETAQVLTIDPATASRRYGRAVISLRDLLVQSGLKEFRP